MSRDSYGPLKRRRRLGLGIRQITMLPPPFSRRLLSGRVSTGVRRSSGRGRRLLPFSHVFAVAAPAKTPLAYI